MIISGASTLLSGDMQRQGGEEQTNAQVMSSMFNAMQSMRMAESYDKQAVDAVERGEDERHKYMQKYGLEMGAMVADAGASGIDVGSGSFLNIMAESAASAVHDGNVIRYNAGLEAQSYKSRAESMRTQTLLELASGQDAIEAGKSRRQQVGLNTLTNLADAANSYGSGMFSGAGSAVSAGKSASKGDPYSKKPSPKSNSKKTMLS